MSEPQLGTIWRPSNAVYAFIQLIHRMEDVYDIYPSDVLFNRILNGLSGIDGGLLERLITSLRAKTPYEVVWLHLFVGPIDESRSATLERLRVDQSTSQFKSGRSYRISRGRNLRKSKKG